MLARPKDGWGLPRVTRGTLFYPAAAHPAGAVRASAEHLVLIDKFLEDAIEDDVDAVADDQHDVGGGMGYIEKAGIHSGDAARCPSICWMATRSTPCGARPGPGRAGAGAITSRSYGAQALIGAIEVMLRGETGGGDTAGAVKATKRRKG